MTVNTDMTAIPRWRTLTVPELEKQYSPSSAIGGNYKPYIDDYSRLSKEARAGCSNIVNITYGAKTSNTIDIALPIETASEGDCPLIAYIHGGYWQEGSKTDSFFGADYFVNKGIAYAAIGYTLTPEASLAQIIAECRSALDSIFSSARTLGIDPGRIVIAGSSAGAHLCAMCCTQGNDGNFATNQFAGAVLLSGIYELEALVATNINEAVGLTRDEARRVSPQLLDTANFPPTIISWGEVETEEFQRQSSAFARKLLLSNNDVEYFEVPGRNHFDIVHDMVVAESSLGAGILNMMNGFN